MRAPYPASVEAHSTLNLERFGRDVEFFIAASDGCVNVCRNVRAVIQGTPFNFQGDRIESLIDPYVTYLLFSPGSFTASQQAAMRLVSTFADHLGNRLLKACFSVAVGR